MEEMQKLTNKIHKDVEPLLSRIIAIEKALVEENFSEEEFGRLEEERDELIYDIGHIHFYRYKKLKEEWNKGEYPLLVVTTPTNDFLNKAFEMQEKKQIKMMKGLLAFQSFYRKKKKKIICHERNNDKRTSSTTPEEDR